MSAKQEACSRREQRGWNGARNTEEDLRSEALCVPRRSEATRREQAQRDNKKRAAVAGGADLILLNLFSII